MIYIKHFFKGFKEAMDWFFDPSEYTGLIFNLIFYVFCAIVLLCQANYLLAAGFISGGFNGIINYLYNTKYPNGWLITIGLLNSVITLGILIIYFIYFV